MSALSEMTPEELTESAVSFAFTVVCPQKAQVRAELLRRLRREHAMTERAKKYTVWNATRDMLEAAGDILSAASESEAK